MKVVKMNTTHFQIFWNKRYPKSVPIGHHLRKDYPDQWFRIHSLPESKRYADNEDERKILLDRHNALMTDLIGHHAEFILVTGRYYYPDPEIFQIEKEYREFECFQKMNLHESDAINLFESYPGYYDAEPEVYFVPASIETIWTPGEFDDLLINIADGETSAVFLGVTRNVVVCPYDGGVDCIVENFNQVAFYKDKYRDWLSRLESGL